MFGPRMRVLEGVLTSTRQVCRLLHRQLMSEAVTTVWWPRSLCCDDLEASDTSCLRAFVLNERIFAFILPEHNLLGPFSKLPFFLDGPCHFPFLTGQTCKYPRLLSCLQVFSFKCRGAFNKMKNLSEEQRQRGVVCSSAGNHAQGVALAASRLVSPILLPLARCLEQACHVELVNA